MSKHADFLRAMAFGGGGGGGVTPTGSVTITENGTYDVTEKAEAVVNVQAQGMTWSDVFKRNHESIVASYPAGDNTEKKITTGQFKFMTTLKMLSIENNSPINFIIDENAFQGCTQLENVALTGNNISLYNAVFFNADFNNGTVDFSGVTYMGTHVFNSTKNLTNVSFQKLTDVPQNTFRGSSDLERAEFFNITSIGNFAFSYTKLNTLIIRNPSTVATLGIDVFSGGTPIGNGNGYIYVPDALVEDYKAATNWATFAAQIKGLSELPS